MLCGMLAATGVAGAPESYFHAPSVERWAESLGITRDKAQPDCAWLARIFAAARCAGAAGTGLFGLRLQAHSLAYFLDRLRQVHPGENRDPAGFSTMFSGTFGAPRYLYLHRRSKLDQAISYRRARQSGLWHQGSDGRDIERLATVESPGYDAAALRESIAEMTGYDRLWEDFFARETIAPLRIDYDRLTKAPHDTLKTILAHLGRDPAAADGVDIPTRKLADATSHAWARRYRDEHGAP